MKQTETLEGARAHTRDYPRVFYLKIHVNIMASSKEDIVNIVNKAKTAFENAKKGLEILNGNNYEQYPFGRCIW